MASKYIGLGTVISVDAAGGSVFATIDLCVTGTPPKRERDLVDFTTLDATLQVHEPGIEKHSEYSFDHVWDPDDTNQTALYTLFGSKVKANWKITYTDATPATWTFLGFVSGVEVQPVEYNKPLMRRITVQRTGAIT
mgnify:CR=1 FL=1